MFTNVVQCNLHCKIGVLMRALGETQAQGTNDRFVYVNTSEQVGDVNHLKVFASKEVAERWCKANDPEGVAFEYEVMESVEQPDEFFESPGG